MSTRDNSQYPTSWSPDGNTLLFQETSLETGADIWTLQPGEEPVPFLATPANERAAQFSPNGKWVLYLSNESGVEGVYIRPFERGGQPTAIASSGGTEPAWSSDGSEIFYRVDDAMMAVPVELGDRATVGSPRILFRGDYGVGSSGMPSYAVGDESQRFLMLAGVEHMVGQEVRVVQNWLDALGRDRTTRP